MIKTSIEMGKQSSIHSREACCLFLMTLIARNHALVVDIKSKGAKGDGVTDDGQAIVNAWKEACGGPSPSTVLFPPGTYMAYPPITLGGPCKGAIEIKATGATVKAPPELAQFKNGAFWIAIQFVDRLTMTGGTFNGQGHEAWKSHTCSNSAPTCHKPVNFAISFATNSLFKDITSLNSKYFHITVLGCNNTNFEHITINAPGGSANTDGFHIGRLSGLNITNSNIKTGDDCISFGDGCKNIHVEKVTCGPGHGISVGSLGKYPNEEPVKGIWVKNCTITDTSNGARIKTWPGSYPSTASDLYFEDIVMDNVANPILIDQYYCSSRSHSCKKGSPSKVKISNVSFRKIRGTSKSQVAVKLNCSAVAPCENVEVADVHLTYQGPGGGSARSQCYHVKPKLVGQVVPPACT